MGIPFPVYPGLYDRRAARVCLFLVLALRSLLVWRSCNIEAVYPIPLYITLTSSRPPQILQYMYYGGGG